MWFMRTEGSFDEEAGFQPDSSSRFVSNNALYSLGNTNLPKFKKHRRKWLAEDAPIGISWSEILSSPWHNRRYFQELISEQIMVILLVFIWYFSAIFAITTSKMIMLSLPLPYTLCTTQFITASVALFLVNYLVPSSTSVTDSGSLSSVKQMTAFSEEASSLSVRGRANSRDSGSRPAGVSMSSSIRDRSSVSNIGTNDAESHGGNLELPNTVADDTSELGLEFDKYSTKSKNISVVSKLLRCSMKNHGMVLYITAFSYTLGFLFTNMAFSVVTASFTETVKAGEPISSVIMAYIILGEVENVPTYMCLIPICAGVACSCLHDDAFSTFGFACAALSNLCFSTRAVYAKKLMKSFSDTFTEVTLFGYVSGIGLCLLVPVAAYMEGTKLYEKFFMDIDNSYIGSRSTLAGLVISNGLAYTCYNTMSFLVLTRTNMVTHAILNCMRRVFIIVFTCYYFDVKLSNTNLAGVGIAVAGVVFFGIFKSRKQAVKNI